LKEKAVKWFDKRLDVSQIRLENVFGIVINELSFKIFNWWESKHWFSIAKIEDKWYDMNSVLSAPAPFKSNEELLAYLMLLKSVPKVEIILVAEADKVDLLIRSNE